MDRARSAPTSVTGQDARPRLSIKKSIGSGDSSSDSGTIGPGTPGSRVSAMDIKRQPKGNRKRNTFIGIGVLAVLVSAYLFSQLEPAAPTIDRNVIVQGTVARGEMVREVRGSGTLVPEHVQFVAAVTAGRVESVHFEPGQTVSASDVLVVLSNPDVELQVLEAEQQWTAARATLVTLRQTLGTGILSQEAAMADARAASLEARREADAFDELVDNEWVSENEHRNAQDRADALEERLRTEQARLDLLNSTIDERLAVQRDQVAVSYTHLTLPTTPYV